MAIEWRKILSGLGIKDDQLPKDDDAEVKYDELIPKLQAGIRAVVENDPAFIKKHKDEAFSNAYAETGRKLKKKFNLKFDKDEDGSDIDKVIDTAYTTATKASSATAQELQTKLAEKEQEIGTLKTTHEKDIENVRGEIVGVLRDSAIESLVETELVSLNDPAKKKKLVSPAKVNVPFVRRELENIAHIEFDPKARKIGAPRQREHPDLKILDGTKELGWSDIIRNIAEKNNLVVDVEEKRRPFNFQTKQGGNEENGTDKVQVTSEGMQKVKEIKKDVQVPAQT